jgi:flagellar biosynthesis protein FliP
MAFRDPFRVTLFIVTPFCFVDLLAASVTVYMQGKKQ